MTKSLNRPTAPPFTAIADCPECGEIGVHWLDEPKRATPKQWREYEKALTEYDPYGRTKVIAWGGESVRTMPINPRPQPPLDETSPIVRVCKACGHRWGNS